MSNISAKFGGKFTRTPEGTTAFVLERIKELKSLLPLEGRLVIVFSAIGDMTNRLTELWNYKRRNDPQAGELLDQIVKFFIDYYVQLLGNETPSIDFDIDIEILKDAFSRVSVRNSESSDESYIVRRDKDHLISFGEVISTVIMKDFLVLKGFETQLLPATSFLVTDDNYGEATPDLDATKSRFSKMINAIPTSKIVLIPGFIGKEKESAYTTLLGREGSDLTLSIVSWLLEKETKRDTATLYFKDQDGVLDETGAVIPLMEIIEVMKIVEKSEIGKIIALTALEFAKQNDMKLWVGNYAKPYDPKNGTQISLRIKTLA